MAITDITDDIAAYMTDYARQLVAQVTMGQLVFQAAGFSVGRGGFQDGIHTLTLDPCHIQPVVTSDTALQDQVYPDAGPVLTLADIAPFQEIDEPATTNVTYEGNTYQNGFTLDGLPSTADITPGSSVTGLNIPPNTIVEDVIDDFSVTIGPNPATANGTGINLTFVTAAPVVVYNCRLASTPIPGNADYALGELGVWAQVVKTVPIVLTGNTLNGNVIVTNISSTANLSNGYSVAGPAIQPGTTIANIIDAHTIQLSLGATMDATNTSLSFLSPSIPPVGTIFLMALAHFPMKGKTRRDTLLLRVVVNY